MERTTEKMPKTPVPRVNSTAPAKPDDTTDGADAASTPSSKTKAAKPKGQASPLREPVANAWKKRREIYSAIEGNDIDALSLLFSAAEEWSRKMAQWAPDGGQTALMFAADEARPECVRLLLPFSEARATDVIGETALMKAARVPPLFGDGECVAECVRLLLPHSDPCARNREGETAMALAVRCGLGVVADLLAPFSPHEDVDRAFKAFGKEGMPAWAAKLEADELAADARLAQASGATVAAKIAKRAARL